jgi:hypothetical protein
MVVVSMPTVVDLPAPVRAEQAEHLARRDVEVDALHRLDPAGVGLGEPANFDGMGFVHAGRTLAGGRV